MLLQILKTNRSFVFTFAGGCSLVMITFGMTHSLGLYLIPISNQLNAGRELFSLAMALQVLFVGIAAPIFGGFADRFSPAKATTVGILILVLSRFWMANIDSPFDLIGSFILGGFGGAGFLGIVLGAIGKSVNPANRSLFAGVIMAAGSFGQFVITPIINALIHNIGWASSLYYIVYISLSLLVCSYFLSFSGKIKSFSKETDQTVFGALKEAAGNKNFKLLTIGFFVCGFHVTFVGTHLPAFLEDQNLPYWLSGWALALIGLFNIVGTLMSGYLSGRMSKKNVLAAIYSLRSILFLFFILSPMNETSVLLFASILGLLWLSTVPPTNGIIADIFGPKYTSMLFGITLLSHNIGSFLGSWLGGRIFDYAGSYDYMWLLCIALGFVSSAFHFPIKADSIERISTSQGNPI